MPNYTDSVARQLNEKLGEHPSVLDFGAARDGSTDDSAALQAAIDSVEGLGGGVVFLPRGTYAIALQVVLKDGVWLAGEGAATVLLRTDDLGAGEALISVTGDGAGVADLVIDGAVTTPTVLKYSDFSLNPMAGALTGNTSIWVRPGVVSFQLLRARITHTGGYALLVDADSADVRDVLVDACTFENNRPHIFKTEDDAHQFGSWTGGIFYRGDCRSSASKPYAVRGLTVRGCSFRRCTGNQIWGHSWGFDVQHSGINVTDNYFEWIGRDAILYGNVAGGSCSGNTIRGIGYLTETDSDTPAAVTGGDFSVGVDTSGFCTGVDYSRNTVSDGPHGEGFDLDGFRDGSLYGNQVSGCLIGINCGDTQNNGAGRRINFIGNVLEGCAYGSMRLNDCEDCSVVGNTINQPDTAAEAPIQMNAVTANGVKGNLVTGNRIHWDKDSWCVIEATAGGSYSSADENRVFGNQISGTNRGEFLKHTDSASTAAQILSTTDPTADEPSEGIVERVGFGSGAAIRFANRIGGTRTEVAQIQDANRMFLVGLAAGEGAVATGDRSALLWGASPDAVATGKLYADAFGVFVGKGITEPGWTSTFSDADADLITTDEVGLLRYNAVTKAFEQSTAVSGGARVWTGLGGGSITGTSHQITVSAGVASLASDGVRIQAATGITDAVLRVRGELAQTVALQEWRKNDETVLAAVDAYGTFFAPAFAARTDTWGPGGSNVEGTYAAREIRFRQDASSEDVDSGLISFRESIVGGLAIYGAGPAAGDRLIYLLDRVGINGKAANPAIVVASGYIDSDEGFYTGDNATNAIQAPTGGVTARYLIGTRSFTMTADSAANAGLSTAGNGRIYFDSTANIFKVSENGGAYVNLVGSGAATPGGSNGNLQYNNSGAFGGSANLNWNNAGQALTITGTSTSASALNVLSGYVDSAGGFNTSSTNSNAIQAATGGVTARFLVATRSVSVTGDTSGNAGLSSSGNGRIYFDSTLNVFRVSENGGAYVNLIGASGISGSLTSGRIPYATGSSTVADTANLLWNNGAQAMTITGTSTSAAALNVLSGYVDSAGGFNTGSTASNAIQAASGGVTARFLVATRSLSMTGDSAANAGLSTTGNGRLYFDSSSNKFRVSENGGAYVDLISSGLAGSLTSGRVPYATGASTLADTSNLAWNNAGQALTITGTSTASPALNVASGYVDSAGGYSTSATATNAIQASTGGVTARFLVATRSLSMTADTEASAGTSTTGNGRVFFDSSLNKFRVSENGGAYVDLIQANRLSGSLTSGRVPYASGANALSDSANLTWNNGSQVLTVNGTSNAAAAIATSTGYIDSAGGFNTSATATNAIQAATGGVTARFIVGTRSFSMTGDSAANAGASTAGNGRIYFDSTANKFKVSENGGAYVDLVGSGAATPGGSNGNLQYNNSGAFGGSANLNWNNAGQALTITGTSTSASALNVLSGYVDSAGGFNTSSTNSNAIQAATGGVTARFLVATRSVSVTGDTSGNAGLSSSGNGRIYFDSTLNVFRVSENGGAYVNLIGASGISGSLTSGRIPYATGSSTVADTANLLWNNGAQAMTITGTSTSAAALNVLSGYVDSAGGFNTGSTASNAIQAASGGVTARFLVATRSLSMTGDSAANAGLSTTGNGRLYFDSSSNKFRVSENGGAYVDLISSGLAGSLTSGRVPYATGASTLADTSNLAWNNAGQALTITGTSTASPALNVASGYVDSAGGYSTSATATNAIQASTGGVTARFLVATRSLSMTADTEASAGTSTTGNGRVFFDSSLNKFRVSENGGAYVDLIQANRLSGSLTSGRVPYASGANALSDSANLTWNNGSQVLTVNGTSNAAAAIATSTGYIDSAGGFNTSATATNAIQAATGGVTARFIVGTRSFSMTGDSAANAGASTAGNGRIYFDSTANKFKVSENGGAYVDLVGSGGLSGLTAGRIPYTSGASAIADTSNLTWNNTTRTLGISAQTNATPAIDAVQGYIAAAGGLLTTATNFNAVQASGGIRTGDGSAGVAGKIYVNFSSLFNNDVNVYGRAISGVNGFHAQNQSGQAAAIMDVYGAGIPAFVGRKANGTIASPSQTLSGDYIMAMGGRGWYSGASDFTSSFTCAVLFAASENWTSTAQGSHIEFATTPIGSTSRSPRMTVRGAGQVEIGSSGGTGILGLYGTGTTPAINPNSSYGALSYKSSSTYYYWNGSAWAEVNFAGGSGITSINSQTGSSITIQGTSLEVDVSSGSNIITIRLPNSVLISNQFQVNGSSGSAIYAPNSYIQGKGLISSDLAAWNALQTTDGGIAASTTYGFSLISGVTQYQAIDYSGGARFVGTGGVYCPASGVSAAGFNPYYLSQYTGYSSDLSFAGGDVIQFAVTIGGIAKTVQLRFTRGALTYYNAF